jgi:hypothetical protein
MISICIRVSSLKLTNYAYSSPLFICCYCKRHMVAASWDILDARRLVPCFQRTTFGQGCTMMSRGSSNDALHAYKLSPNLIPLVSICLYLFHMHHGRTFAWILFWVCHGHEMDMTQYLWSLIIFPKWHILFHVVRPTMLHILLICFLGISFDSWVSNKHHVG